MTSFYLNYLLKTLSPDIVTLGICDSTYEFWGHGGVIKWENKPIEELNRVMG